MTEFKVGDKVIVDKVYEVVCGTFANKLVDYFILTQVEEYFRYEGYKNNIKIDECSCCYKIQHFKLLETNQNKIMNIKELFALSFKKEPQKSFVKAGITDSNDMLTTDGQEIFLTYLLNKNGDAFKTEVVDALLAENSTKE